MRMLAGLLLAGWLIAALALTVLPAHPSPGQVVHGNPIPFHTIATYLHSLGSWFWVRNALGNLGLLLPLGLLGPIALPALNQWWRVAIVALLISTAIELTQLAVPDRSADIDDVIVNVTGALLGYLTLSAARLATPAA